MCLQSAGTGRSRAQGTAYAGHHLWLAGGSREGSWVSFWSLFPTFTLWREKAGALARMAKETWDQVSRLLDGFLHKEKFRFEFLVFFRIGVKGCTTPREATRDRPVAAGLRRPRPLSLAAPAPSGSDREKEAAQPSLGRLRRRKDVCCKLLQRGRRLPKQWEPETRTTLRAARQAQRLTGMLSCGEPRGV